MKISAKGYYAVLAMMDMVKQTHNDPIPLSNISVRQEISLSFLEQLFVKMRREKLVKSVRGPGGGYLLAKKPKDITIGNILHSVGEDLSISECVDLAEQEGGGCSKINDCAASQVWKKIYDQISGVLDSINLEDISREDEKSHKKKKVGHRYPVSI